VSQVEKASAQAQAPASLQLLLQQSKFVVQVPAFATQAQVPPSVQLPPQQSEFSAQRAEVLPQAQRPPSVQLPLQHGKPAVSPSAVAAVQVCPVCEQQNAQSTFSSSSLPAEQTTLGAKTLSGPLPTQVLPLEVGQPDRPAKASARMQPNPTLGGDMVVMFSAPFRL
jgi:hypothetical protein